MPPRSQWPALTPTPQTVAWERGGDVRLLMAAGYALLLQVAHPTVGAGVSEHSQFKTDPWGRLLRTLDYVYTMIYGGPEAAGEMGLRIRAAHLHIAGTTADGRRYSAMEPEAYAWVHATLAQSIVAAHARFGRPLDLAEQRELWLQWRSLGRLVGVRARDLPVTWDQFGEYFEAIVEQRLVRTPAVTDVLDALAHPALPALGALPGSRILGLPAGHVLELASVGLLPARLRVRFGLGWSRSRELELSLLAGGLRAATPLMPPWLRRTGPAYLSIRRRAIGEIAAVAGAGH